LLVAALVFCVIVTLLSSVAGPEPETARSPRNQALRG